MLNKSLLIGLLFFTLAHIMVWFQLNGQFIWSYFKNNTFLLALCGVPISYLYIYGTKYTAEGFDGLLWPTRLVGFGIGIFIYAIMLQIFMGEGITLKTGISIFLALTILCVQVLLK